MNDKRDSQTSSASPFIDAAAPGHGRQRQKGRAMIRGWWAWVVGIVCGVELVALVMASSAGLGAALGLEGAFVGALALTAIGRIFYKHDPESSTFQTQTAHNEADRDRR